MSDLSEATPSKRKAIDLEAPNSTPAAEFNRKVYRRLQRELETNPEVDLRTILPSNYAVRLAEKASGSRLQTSQIPSPTPLTPPSHRTETPMHLNEQEDCAEIPFGLTRELEELFLQERQPSDNADSQSTIASGIHKAIQNGSVLWRSEVSSNNMIVKCNDQIVVKIIPRTSDYTEFTSMRYLQRNLPDVPAPRPLGVVSSGCSSYIFMTYVPGVSLDNIWPGLDEKQKTHITSELNEILERMRQPKCPPGVALGGVGGEGCKDARRNTRTSQDRLFDTEGFVAFLFSNPHFGGRVYIDLLRRFWQMQDTSIVFTHGDLHPSNVMIEEGDDNYHRVTGLVDWERSGYYPDWFECIKTTNNLSTTESDNDWNLFLPTCISPQRYPLQWLLDRVWDPHIA